MTVLASELQWVWSPAVVLALILSGLRRYLNIRPSRAP
jgi:hypothetical protein